MEAAPFLLKNIYSPAFVGQIAAEVRSTYAALDVADFERRVFDAEWPTRELKQRTRHLSTCLRATLPPDYRDALAVLTTTVARMVARDGDRLAFEWGVFPDFVEAYGADDPDASLPALEVLTRLSSAEFAIRPFLLRHFERTVAQMRTWATHSSPMVRRLATEGMRPRLPWGMGVPALKRDPDAAWPILERLKNDPAETVRRSIANHLNDISKDHPERVLDAAERWYGQSDETDWVVRHACRGLLKQGNPRALALFGFERGAAGIEVSELRYDPTVARGDTWHFSFLIKNAAPRAQKIRLEYALHFLTSTGGMSRKVFKIKELEYAPAATERIERHQRFIDFTTRKHYAGPHRIDVVANGEVLTTGAFEVV
jgi:3-methyladenine DNA glycosylase AlkC